jgi:hypothetical protein
MARTNREREPRNETRKKRKGDTGRTSSQGRKLSSGGRPETDNQGRPNADNPQSRNKPGPQGLNM